MPAPSYVFRKRASGFELLRSVSSSKNTRESSTERVRRPSEKYYGRVLNKIGDKSVDYVERTQAVVEMRGLLEVLDPDTMPEVWFAAHPLIAPEISRATRRAALELLRACIAHTRDDFIKSIFFQIIYDCLVPPGEEKKLASVDRDLDLILSCLNQVVNENDALLTIEDRELLTETVANLITLEFQEDPKGTGFTVILELLALAQKLSIPLKDVDVGNFLEILKKISETGHGANTRFQAASFGLIDCYWDEIKADSLDNTLLMLINTSAIMTQDNLDLTLRPLLQRIVNTPRRDTVWERLIMLPLRKSIDRGAIIKCYAGIYIGAFDEGKVSIEDVFRLLNSLYLAKFDKDFLEVTGSLLDMDFFIRSWVAAEKGTGIVLWPLLKKVLLRSKWSQPQVVDRLLCAMTNYPSSVPVSPEVIIHCIVQNKVSIDIGNLCASLNSRALEVKNLNTLQELADFVMQAGLSSNHRLQLIQFFKAWLMNANVTSLTKESGQLNWIWSIYLKFESFVVEDDELVAFNDLLCIFLQIAPMTVFESLVVDHLLPTVRKILLQKRRRKSFVGSIGSFGRSRSFSKTRLKIFPMLIKTLVKSFIWSPFEPTGFKCVLLFDTLISVYEYAEQCEDSATLLTIARAMVRIRRDCEGIFYFANPEDAVGISSAFGRHAEQISTDTHVEWTFPETLDFIDSELLGKRNGCVTFETKNYDTSGKVNMGVWLSLAVNTIEDPVNLEIYSYLLTHLCSQLSELTLFEGHYEGINKFKNVICQHLRQSLPSNIKPNDALSRSDLNSAYVRNLSAVLAYHHYETKSFADDLVNALVFGLTSWEKTLIPILHILTVSCFEIPVSVKRYITPILLELQKRITTLHAIPSILEFLLALQSSPPLISNLTPNETKRVFAIVFTLIENSIYVKLRSKSFSHGSTAAPQKVQFSSRPQDYDVEVSPSTDGFLIGESMTRFLQYQSFMVLSNWLFNVKGDQAVDIIHFVMKGLEKLAKIEDLKYDALAYMDFVSRLEFSLPEQTLLLRGKNATSCNDSNQLSRWINGSCLISIRTSAETNRVFVELKRPSSETIFEIKPSEQLRQPNYKLFDFENDNEPNQEVTSKRIMPEHFLPLVCTQGIDQKLFKLPDNANFNRSVNLLDRIPNVEFQKTGIIYIGPGQKTESEVLSNDKGSNQYHWFLTEMGHFIKLKETSKFFYRGGLDPETDGEYALVWNNATTQITFHAVTLMPAHVDLSFKKRHVGNDFVNIFYNDSGLYSFNFNLIKSQFTFINVVITPETTGSSNQISQHYKVKLYRRSGVPGLLSCAHFKILDKSNLARYVRHVSLIANALAEKYNETGSQDACSIWGVRCKQLLAIHERAAHEDH